MQKLGNHNHAHTSLHYRSAQGESFSDEDKQGNASMFSKETGLDSVDTGTQGATENKSV